MARRFTCKAAGVKTCDFFVESELKDELVEMVQDHVEDKHDKSISREEVLEVSESTGHEKSYEKSSGGVNP